MFIIKNFKTFLPERSLGLRFFRERVYYGVMDQEKIYTIAFSHIEGVGPVSFARLTAYFPTLYEAWHASAKDYTQAGLSMSVIEKTTSEKSKIDIEAIL